MKILINHNYGSKQKKTYLTIDKRFKDQKICEGNGPRVRKMKPRKSNAHKFLTVCKAIINYK